MNLEAKEREYEKFYNDLQNMFNNSRNQYGILAFLYTILLSEYFDILLYYMNRGPLGFLNSIPMILFSLGMPILIFGLVHFALFLFPVSIAYSELPSLLFEDVYSQYIQEGYSAEESIELTKESKVEMLKKCNEINFARYISKRGSYYNSIFGFVTVLALTLPAYFEFLQHTFLNT